MKKQSAIILLSLCVINSGCVTTETSAEKQSIQADSAQATSVKKHQHKRRALPNGAISLDIVEYNNTLHILLGKHDQGKNHYGINSHLILGKAGLNSQSD